MAAALVAAAVAALGRIGGAARAAARGGAPGSLVAVLAAFASDLGGTLRIDGEIAAAAAKRRLFLGHELLSISSHGSPAGSPWRMPAALERPETNNPCR